ncbi:hypothetical protein B0H13DRAFT_1614009 [Mycena leptocephala]|nr:hypothetical protein B0H13DRAFT_1614009 [Mycena leptocephala]
MLKCAEKYGEFDIINPSFELRKQLPLFHHFGQDPTLIQRNNTAPCTCLRNNHNVRTTGEGMSVMARLQDNQHRLSPSCQCLACAEDRRVRGCNNPHSCARTVGSRLDHLLPKWDPRRLSNDDTYENTEEHLDSTIFIAPKQIRTVSEGFRVLTKAGARETTTPVVYGPRQRNTLPSEIPVKIFISGTIIQNPEGIKSAGSGIWYGTNDDRNIALHMPEYTPQSSASAKIHAALEAVQRADPETALKIYSNHKSLSNTMIRNLGKWEDQG